MNSVKNVAIWVRVSTEMQVFDESPLHHEERGRAYAKAKGWNIVAVYRLDALSGKSIMDYSETKRMLKDIKDGVITGLIFSKLARLARNTQELLQIAEIFRAENADLISLAESIDTSTPAGRLFFTMIAAMAQWEREEISARVAASVPVRAKLGKSLGGAASFGYRWQENELVIDEKEGPIRREIYEIFSKSKRKKATANRLNDLGYRTRNGSKFTDTTVTRLLKDSTAKGTRIANYTKSLGEGKHWELKPPTEWIEIACPPVVDTSLWDECNSILLQQERKYVKLGPQTNYLLAGYLYCSCGTKMYVYHSSPTFKCKACKRKIEVADIDEIYYDQLESFLLTNINTEKIMSQSLLQIQEKELLLRTAQSDFNKLNKRVLDIANIRLDGELSKADFANLYKPLEEQLRQLEKQIPELEAEIDFMKVQSLSLDTIAQDANDLYSKWPTISFDEKRSIIETITEKIIVDKDEINIKLSYQPNSLEKAGKRQRTVKDS